MAFRTERRYPFHALPKISSLLLFICGMAVLLARLKVDVVFISGWIFLSLSVLASVNAVLVPEIWNLISAKKVNPGTWRRGSSGQFEYQRILSSPLMQAYLIFCLAAMCFGLARYEDRQQMPTRDQILKQLTAIQSQLAQCQAVQANRPQALEPVGTSSANCLKQLCPELMACVQQNVNTNANGKGPQAKPEEATLKLSPDLEKAIEAYLKSQSVTGSDFTWAKMGVGGILLLLLVVLAIGLSLTLVKKHPSTAAPLGAVSLASLAITNTEKFGHLENRPFLIFVWLFVGVSAVLLVICLIQLYKPQQKDIEGEQALGQPEPQESKDKETTKQEEKLTGEERSLWALLKGLFHKPHKGEEGKEKGGKVAASPLAVGFSLAILIWAVVFVARPPEPKHEAKVTINPLMHDSLEEPISHFASGHSMFEKPDENLQLRQLREAVEPYKNQKGDLLLLLGSADCSEIRNSEMTNNLLAQRRALGVRENLQKYLGTDLNIEIVTPNQHQNCMGSGDMRAVFPILIHPKPVDRNQPAQ